MQPSRNFVAGNSPAQDVRPESAPSLPQKHSGQNLDGLDRINDWLRTHIIEIPGLVTAYVFGSSVTGDFTEGQSDIDVGLVMAKPEQADATLMAELALLIECCRIPLDFAVLSMLEFPPPSHIFRYRLLHESRLLYGSPYLHLVKLPSYSELRQECLFELSTIVRGIRTRLIDRATQNSPAENSIKYCFKTSLISLRCLALLKNEKQIHKAALVNADGPVANSLSFPMRQWLRLLTAHYLLANQSDIPKQTASTSRDRSLRAESDHIFDTSADALLQNTLNLAVEVQAFALAHQQQPFKEREQRDSADPQQPAGHSSADRDLEWKVSCARFHNCSAPAIVVRNDRETIAEYIDRGFRHLPRTAQLRYPYVSVIDLSELGPEWDGLPADIVLMGFDIIGRVLRNSNEGPGTLVHWSPPLVALTITGYDRNELEKQKREILHRTFTVLGLPTSRLGRRRDITRASKQKLAQAALEKHADTYAQWVLPEYRRLFPLFNPGLLPEKSVWHEVQKLEGKKVFVAHAGVVLLGSYIAATGDEEACLLEYHISGDPYPALRERTIGDKPLWIGNAPSGSEPVLLCDRAYSGSTLNKLRGLLGNNLRTLGYAPKSLEAVAASDYVVFDECLLASSTIPQNSDWYITVLRETRANCSGSLPEARANARLPNEGNSNPDLPSA